MLLESVLTTYFFALVTAGEKNSNQRGGDHPSRIHVHGYKTKFPFSKIEGHVIPLFIHMDPISLVTGYYPFELALGGSTVRMHHAHENTRLIHNASVMWTA